VEYAKRKKKTRLLSGEQSHKAEELLCQPDLTLSQPDLLFSRKSETGVFCPSAEY